MRRGPPLLTAKGRGRLLYAAARIPPGGGMRTPLLECGRAVQPSLGALCLEQV